MITDSPDFDVTELSEQLVRLASDEDARVSSGALILLYHLKLKPVSLWGTYAASSSSSGRTEIETSIVSSVINLWIKLIKSNGVSERAYACLAMLATENDSPLLEALIASLEGLKAAVLLQAIRDCMIGDPCTLAQVAAGEYTVPPWQEDMVIKGIDGLTGDVLGQLITGPHKSNKLRGAALEEAGRRNALSTSVLLAAFASEDPTFFRSYTGTQTVPILRFWLNFSLRLKKIPRSVILFRVFLL